MPSEPGTVLVIELGGFFFVFGIVPLVYISLKLRAVWRASRGLGSLLSAVVVLTGLFVIFEIVGVVVIFSVPILK